MQFPMALPTELSGHFKLSFKNKWCRLSELNGWPTDYKSVALPTELSRHTKIVCVVHYNHFKRDYQIMVPRGGIEPPTRGFSILCSTDWAIWANLVLCRISKRIFNAIPKRSTDWAIWAIFSFMQNINKDFQCNSRWLYRLSYLGILNFRLKINGADYPSWTDDLLITSQLLYQLS